jgi:hypothetical protein
MDSIGEWLTIAPWRDRSVSLIYISADRVELSQEHTLSGKRELITLAQARAEHRPLVLVAWHGQRRTDVRVAPERNWEAIADALV